FLLGIGFVVYAARHGARPSLPLLAAALAVWVVWIATGFHVNGHTMVGFDPAAEALNEGTKTLWALAYLAPLMRSRRATLAPIAAGPRPYAAAAADPTPLTY